MRRIVLLSLFLSFVSLAGAVHAAKTERLSELRLQPQQFSDYRARIEKELSGGESLAEMAPEHRKEVRAILERMDSRLSGVESIEQLPMKSRTALFNDQERLRVLLGQAEEDSRLVCRRERTLGSNMPRSVCMTVAERRRATEDAQNTLRREQAPAPLVRGN